MQRSSSNGDGAVNVGGRARWNFANERIVVWRAHLKELRRGESFAGERDSAYV
jgi:hypothetical protein